MASEPSFIAEPLPIHRDIPTGFKLDETEARFDPRIHLAIEPPTSVKTLEFDTVPFPYPEDVKASFSGLAYSKPFRLLSDEGLKLLRGAVDKNMKLAKQNERLAICIRGMCYNSRAVRDFTYCPEVLDLMSALAGKPLAPHGVSMNIGHTNRSVTGSTQKVDQWHTDSVDYVFVLILSDIDEMVGGELQVLQQPDARGALFDRLKAEGIPTDLVETASYAKAGYCMFMQGSRILHQVTPVLSAHEPRLSFVNSFMSRNVFDPDTTRFHTFKHQDPLHVTFLEFARHKAWRAKGQLEYIINEAKFGRNNYELAELVRRIAKELHDASLLIDETKADKLDWLDDKPSSKL